MAPEQTPPPSDPQAEGHRAWLREGLLLAGFLGVIAIAAWTVAIPELSDDAEEPEASAAQDAGAPE